MTASGEHLGDDTIVAMLAGRVEPDARARLDAHAASCTACRELLSALARQLETTGATTLVAQPVADRAANEIEIPDRVGRYMLTRAIGAGGMGMVFAAHDPDLDRTVAVKLLRSDVGDADSRRALEMRLRREARAMAKLSHPNVVTVYDVGMQGDRVFIAMELVDGVTLDAWLEAPRTLASILEVFRAAGRGLAAAHAKAIVHRDFKPGNVLVGIDGRVRVTDFGVAKLGPGGSIASSARSAVRTMTDAALGTPYYMAPEQLCGEPVDPRADQFSFCVALYAAVHGVRPFAGTTLEEIAAAILAQRITPPPNPARIPTRIHTAIIRGLAVKPDDRFLTMDALLGELIVEPPRSRRRMIIAIALACTAAAGVVAIATRSSPHAITPVDAAARSQTVDTPREPRDAAAPVDAAPIVEAAPDASSRPPRVTRPPRSHPTDKAPAPAVTPAIPDVDRGD